MIGAKGRRGSGTMSIADRVTSTSERPPRPVILKGIAGSHGLAIGPSIIIGALSHSFVRRTVKPREVDTELARFTEAVSRAQEGIRIVVEKVKSGHARAETSILEAYVQMLGDELVAEGVERNIRINRQNAEWAVSNTIQELCDRFEDMEDPYLVERRHDVAFVGERIIRALSGSDRVATLPKLTRPSVVLSHDLSPADTAALVKEPVVAIITEVGTRTSHTSIMARALEIPAVVGVADALGRIGPGDIVIVDGFRGEVTVAPTPEMIADAEARAKKHIAMVRHLREDRDKQTATADGVAVHLRANIEFPAEAPLAVDHGAEGIGLYRTEFLYVDRAAPPDEEEQYEVYRAVLETMHPRPATLRTFDIGGDKFVSTFQVPPEMNPALGLRAVRLALSRPDVFLAQLRAMVRASAHGEMRIMIPMIASLREFEEVRRLLGVALREVAARGQKHAPTIPLGVMIEVPGAAVMADLFAREADFLSLGTNDLVQYALAIDRTSRSLAYLASPFDPAILRLIVTSVTAAQKYNRPISVCGAMASDPLAAVLLVGLGVRELSMEAAAIPEIKEALHRVSLPEAEAVAAEAMRQESAEDVERALAAAFAPRLFDLLADAAGETTT
ncbi:MAG TPA: phosphoenolpyruvate--protein phosphotransferase [Polyangiaceae bacterium]|nr:phosphoenolpyruvate--protein phosphotransferase [Polyangiaceae bacterium]